MIVINYKNESIDIEFEDYIHVSKLGIDSRLYNSYEKCPNSISSIADSLNIRPSDSFLDIGCGKGYVMYVMAKRGFSRIDGIEICPQLANQAILNLSHIFGDKDERFHVYQGNAEKFIMWDNYSYVFMYNPFKEECMKKVLKSIKNSIAHKPRIFSLIYYNPLYDNIVMESEIFNSKIQLRSDCYIYQTH